MATAMRDYERRCRAAETELVQLQEQIEQANLARYTCVHTMVPGLFAVCFLFV